MGCDLARATSARGRDAQPAALMLAAAASPPTASSALDSAPTTTWASSSSRAALLARLICCCARRRRRRPPTKCCAGRREIDLAERAVRIDGQLRGADRATQFELLIVLARSAGRDASREQIMDDWRGARSAGLRSPRSTSHVRGSAPRSRTTLRCRGACSPCAAPAACSPGSRTARAPEAPLIRRCAFHSGIYPHRRRGAAAVRPSSGQSAHPRRAR